MRMIFAAAACLFALSGAGDADAKVRRAGVASIECDNLGCTITRDALQSKGQRNAAAPDGMRALVDAAAFAAGVPASIAHAVIAQESGYRPGLRGKAGEYGIGQIKCQTARGVGFTGACGSLFDAATNLRWSMAYLRKALDRGGPGCAGVTLYNTGIYARPHCSAYGRSVMARAGRS